MVTKNRDPGEFFWQRLKNEYEILEADNGSYGLQQGFDIVPDLIITDILIPGTDGIDLVHFF